MNTVYMSEHKKVKLYNIEISKSKLLREVNKKKNVD